jgi:hypothetical protein
LRLFKQKGFVAILYSALKGGGDLLALGITAPSSLSSRKTADGSHKDESMQRPAEPFVRFKKSKAKVIRVRDWLMRRGATSVRRAQVTLDLDEQLNSAN